MRKLFLMSLLLLSIGGLAKGPFGPSVVPFKKNVIYLEIMGGGILRSMDYQNSSFDNYKPGLAIGQTEGLGIRIQNSKMFSYSALISYREQGVSFPELNNYALDANYLNLFVPLEIGIRLFKPKKKASPRIIGFAGPYIATLLKGSLTSGSENYALTSTDIQQYDAGVEGGIGIRIPIFSIQGKSDLNFKVAYSYGLMNTFVKGENPHDPQLMDLSLLSNSGNRWNRGIRISISYDMSFSTKKLDTFVAGGDGKRTYKRFLGVTK
ncbi:MAG: hypothetical protein ACERKD_04995 [Prolixibacteraceae bacterium]